MSILIFMAIILRGTLSQSYYISALAGGSRGFLDSDGLHSKFDRPSGLIVDPLGRIVIADTVLHDF